MYFSYITSVIMVSLAIYGGWLLIKDMWEMFIEPRFAQMPSASFLIVTKDCENEIEDMIRYLMSQIEMSDSDSDVVVVDYSSQDITPLILARLADEYCDGLTVLNASPNCRPVAEGMPHCRGGVVHVLDIGNRLNYEEFMLAVCWLLEQGRREAAVLHND